MHVALHEIGHSLGLLHSNNKDAVMYAMLNKTGDPKLHQDDINGIQAIYGNENPDTNIIYVVL